MKDIDKMNLAELADALQRFEFDMLNEAVANRLRVIHEETRWIPVSERMPTEADGDWLFVIRHSDVQISHMDDMWGFSHFKRIDKPEGV
jgi:hypothetical protein